MSDYDVTSNCFLTFFFNIIIIQVLLRYICISILIEQSTLRSTLKI